jgi:hypothetical protein
VPAFVGTVQYTDDEIEDVVDAVKTRAWLLAGTQLLFPVGLVLLGLVCVAAGVFIRRRADADAHDEHRKELVNA